MFKRRKPRSYSQIATDMVYPRGGWRRAGTYVLHRVRRLPDQPNRIGRGIASGIFVSCTPTFGLHFILAAICAWVIRGNVLAALFATFLGNPVTIPFVAVASVSLGRKILGVEGELSTQMIFSEFARASAELWHNVQAAFGPKEAEWNNLGTFLHNVYWPYFIGGIIIGLLISTTAHYLTVPLIRAYHKRREKKMANRIARVIKSQKEKDVQAHTAAPAAELPKEK